VLEVYCYGLKPADSTETDYRAKIELSAIYSALFSLDGLIPFYAKPCTKYQKPDHLTFLYPFAISLLTVCHPLKALTAFSGRTLDRSVVIFISTDGFSGLFRFSQNFPCLFSMGHEIKKMDSHRYESFYIWNFNIGTSKFPHRYFVILIFIQGNNHGNQNQNH
tara:strand:+ start:496 stop:984 length:489 start_codon:yes stop_codon:yes gene_type:complete